MTTNLIITGQSSEKKPIPASAAFAGKGLVDHPSASLQKLRENLRSCSTAREGFCTSSFSESVCAATNTRISGGTAIVLQTEASSFLLYKEPYKGFHLIVSGLLGAEPDSATVIRSRTGEQMYLLELTESRKRNLEAHTC